MPRVCVFDVNETLLDLGALDPRFEEAFGDAAARSNRLNISSNSSSGIFKAGVRRRVRLELSV